MTTPDASRVEEARRDLETFVRQMVDDDGALAIKDANGRGLTHFADAFAAAVRADVLAQIEELAMRMDTHLKAANSPEEPRTAIAFRNDLLAALSDLAEGK